jgi:hypothetical protein
MLQTDELLEEKYRAQKLLNDKSQNDLSKYFKNIDRIVEELQKERKLKFKFRTPIVSKKENHTS